MCTSVLVAFDVSDDWTSLSCHSWKTQLWPCSDDQQWGLTTCCSWARQAVVSCLSRSSVFCWCWFSAGCWSSMHWHAQAFDEQLDGHWQGCFWHADVDLLVISEGVTRPPRPCNGISLVVVYNRNSNGPSTKSCGTLNNSWMMTEIQLA